MRVGHVNDRLSTPPVCKGDKMGPIDSIARFWGHVDLSGPIPNARPDLGACWLWTGSLNNGGYGRHYITRRTQVAAHRLSYELNVGPIPDGLTIDHLCKVQRCVNPQHLEPVTMAENILRADGFSGVHARKTHCSNGHPFTPGNILKPPPKRPTRRYCRQCYNAYRSARNARKRAEREAQND